MRSLEMRTKALSWMRAVFQISMAVALLMVADPVGNRAEGGQAKDNAVRELESIGKKLAQAVLTKDIEAILAYEKPEAADGDRQALNERFSDLYCTVFDSSCITWGHRSVYDIIRSARLLAIRVKDLGRGTDGLRYGWILFFDRARIDQRRLRSPEYICEKGGKEIASWRFVYVGGKWRASTPPFDAETDMYCNPDKEESRRGT